MLPPANGFRIDSLNPSGYDDIWVVEVALTTAAEEMGARSVAHNMQVKARFQYPYDGSVSGLLRKAHAQINEVVAQLGHRLAANSIETLLKGNDN